MLDLLQKLETVANRAMSRTRRWVDTGPFRAYFDETSDLIWLNYAAPLRTLGQERQTRDAVATLAKEFASRQRKLRFEFIEPLWPSLPAILRSAGLKLQAAQPLMICGRASARRQIASGLRVTTLHADDPSASLDTFIRTSAQAFGEECPPIKIPERRARLRVELSAGVRRAVMGWIGDRPAGVAAISPTESIGELVGVATLSDFRRRGIASMLSSHLVFDHFQRGGDLVWLSAADSVAQGMYAHIGFIDAGIYANYIAP